MNFNEDKYNMSDHVCISIIIPVYNVEKYLRQCLDSIKNQTFKDFECICVNDGSTDDSLSILQEYANKDNRFKIIHQNNKGISEARNVGIKLSVGDYILFIDSDDFIDSKFCEILYMDAIKYKADIVFGGIYKYYSDKQKYKVDVLNEFCGEDIKNCSIKYISIDKTNKPFFFSKFYRGHVVAWGRLIQRQLLKNNEICFYKEKVAEDYTFTALNLLYAKNIVINETVNYYYRKGISNCTSKKNDNMVKSTLKNFKTLKEDLINRKQTDDDILKLVDFAAIDILFGYYDNWKTGRFSKCSMSVIKELYCDIKNKYLDFFNINKHVALSNNVWLKMKYKMFYFGVNHNIYIMPKLIRILRNIIRIFVFK